MMTREDLDHLYGKLWAGSDEAFIVLLEYFMPFAEYGFKLVDEQGNDEHLIHSIVYSSRFIELTIIRDFEQYQGLGSILFEYKRIRNAGEGKKRCKKSIMTDIRRNTWLHYFLSDILPQNTQLYPVWPPDLTLLPVEEAFKSRLKKDERLKALELRSDGFEPAYTAAFEAFCWEYYGEHFFRLFRPENQAERDALARYAYEYYRANLSAEAIRKWEEDEKRHKSVPPWKICL